MNHYWLIKIHPVFEGTDEMTGELLVFRNWREQVVDVFAQSFEGAKQTAAITGFIDGKHYNDIVKQIK